MIFLSFDWQLCALSKEASVREAINNLNSSSKKIVLVTDHENHLIGTVTDGDIRRGLIDGTDIDSPLHSIMNISPVTASSKLSTVEVANLMGFHGINQIPYIDEDNSVAGLYLTREAGKAYNNTLVIMAGGKGSRLLPRTEKCPKPLLEVHGKPILRHIIDKAKYDGFHNILISVNHLGQMIKDYCGDGSDLGVSIEYLHEDKPLGTAGALKMFDPIPLSPFILTNGDLITSINYSDLLNYHLASENMVTVTVKQHIIENPFGVVEVLDQKITGFKEKPKYSSLINAGIYVMNPKVLSFLDGSYCDMPHLISRLIKIGYDVGPYFLHEPWDDIGRPIDLDRVNGQFDAE